MNSDKSEDETRTDEDEMKRVEEEKEEDRDGSWEAFFRSGACIGTVNRRAFESGGMPRTPNAGAKFKRPKTKLKL